jgi:hypothetical protein
MDKINVATFLESFRRLVGQSPPPISLRINHSTKVTEPLLSHTLKINITLVELLQALEKLQKNKVAFWMV